MRAFIKGHKKLAWLAVLSAPLWLSALWIVAAPLRGNIAAHIDVARGRYVHQNYGLVVYCVPPSVIRKMYGIETWSHGCNVAPWEISYIDAYNTVSEVAIKRKFGERVFESAKQQAMRDGVYYCRN